MRTKNRKPSRAQAPTLVKEVEAIRRLKKRAEIHGRQFLADIVEIGKRLSRARERVGHGNWLPWLRKNFNWSGDTAGNYVRLYQLSQTAKFRSLRNLPLDLLYLLARKSFPEAIRDDIADRIERGEPVNARQEIGRITLRDVPAPPRTAPQSLSLPGTSISTPLVLTPRGYERARPDPALDDSTPSEDVEPELKEIEAQARQIIEPPIDRYEVLLAAWEAASEDERVRFLAKIKARLLS
jgi:Protein of unknown function (DUF3102)